MRYKDTPQLTKAAHAARRFQFIANCYRAKAASPASLRHEAQSLIDMLWALGLRPQHEESMAAMGDAAGLQELQ